MVNAGRARNDGSGGGWGWSSQVEGGPVAGGNQTPNHNRFVEGISPVCWRCNTNDEHFSPFPGPKGTDSERG